MIRIHIPLLSALFLVLPDTSFGAGNHYGWCQGVGNPHKSANCGSAGGSSSSGATPANIPTSNELPQTGSGPQPTPSNLPNPIIVTPNLPDTFTGTSPVQKVVGQPGPSFTGYGRIITIAPNAPTTFTGTSPVVAPQAIPTPSFTGQGQQIITVIPNPPTTFTGTSPVIAPQPLPTPSFTGQGQIPVPNPTSATVIVSTPMISPNVVQPGSSGSNRYKVKYLPRPKPKSGFFTGSKSSTGAAITHKPTITKMGPDHVTRVTGRQAPHDPPRFAAKDGGKPWRCVASGHGKRRTFVDGEVSVSGALRHVGALDVLARDLPALHPQHAECIISIRQRKD